jgi:hypothetical protein
VQIVGALSLKFKRLSFLHVSLCVLDKWLESGMTAQCTRLWEHLNYRPIRQIYQPSCFYLFPSGWTGMFPLWIGIVNEVNTVLILSIPWKWKWENYCGGVHAGRIVYWRPHIACSFRLDIHTTMRSASGVWRVGWSAAWSVSRNLTINEDSVAAAAEWCIEILLSMIIPSKP